MQKAYIDALYALVETDKRIVSVVADNGTDYDWLFQRDYPSNFYNVGIAEQNMTAMAAGLSDTGLIPFITTAGAFLIYRAYEFIRDDICLGKRNVKMFASGSGVSISNLGPTHHATEDIALLRTLHGLTVLSPSTPNEMTEAVKEGYRINGPVYIRGGMTGECNFDLSENVAEGVVCDAKGKQIIICTTGSILKTAYDAVERLRFEGYDVGLFHFTKLMPFNKEAFLNIVQDAKFIVSVEDHQVSGGLGGIISETMADYGINTPLLKLGYNGFVTGYGTRDELRELNNLSSKSIVNKIKKGIGCE